MSKRKRPRPTIVGRHLAGPDHAVVTVTSSKGDSLTHARRVCGECPWRLDAPIGAFPAEAYRHSATTAYDMAPNTFACHMAGIDRPTTCAGFLLANSVHNLAVRLAAMTGRISFDAIEATADLYPSYRAMAEANGVAPDDPALARCRADDE